MARNYYRLGLAFENEGSASSSYTGDDWLEIVQPEWDDIDQAGFGSWLATNNKTLPQTGGIPYIDALFKLMAEYRSNCDGDGCLEVELQIHKSRDDLAYKLVASYGELSERFIHTKEVTESIDVEMEESTTIKRSLVDLVGIGVHYLGDAVWEGEVYDAYGNEIVPPQITLDGSTYSWGVKCVGTIRVKYMERHDAYILTIQPRETGTYDPEQPEDAYESTVRAFWQDTNGDPHCEKHEVELPDMFGNCSAGASVHVSGPGDDDDGEKCYIHHIEVDPCTKDVLNEWDEEVECPGAADA